MLLREVSELRAKGIFQRMIYRCIKENITVVTRRWMWLQHDGAPPLFGRRAATF
jgi:hypothetical protein